MGLLTLGRGLSIDKKKGLLHKFIINYAVYDVLSGDLKDKYQGDAYFKEVGIESLRSNYAMAGGHIVTTDRKEGVVGAFNTTTHKFDWVHKE
ncbi:hypothetical protein [Microbulbifer echini]|uniref:hypothetical protein n=1 Tax=Microbulbifer echini TaxID=1529067 RepID=UPI003530B21D